ncbi:MAG: dTDP-4-dehydrorhamnose 3,5-epimerase [Candidatus Aphodosoma sp.]
MRRVDGINGVVVTPLRRIHTPKGDVLHAMKSTDVGYAGFGEVYFSEVLYGDVKGWKRHNRMALNIVVVKGMIRFTIYDDRVGSPTCGSYMQVVLSPDSDSSYARLTVDPGLWMAFDGIAHGVSLLMDVIPEPHDPAEADRRELSYMEYPLG